MLQDLIGDLPKVENRKFYTSKGIIKEWSPSKYFKSIDTKDDEGGNNDVLFYGPTTGIYHTCAISESNMKRAFVKRMLYGGKQQILSHKIRSAEDDACLTRRGEILQFLEEKFIPEYIKPLEAGWTYESALQYWMDNCKRYTVKKKKELLKLQKQILSGTYEARYHGKDDPLGLAVINVFQKCENYPEVKEPRAISACSQECKALLGGFYHLLEIHAKKSTPFFVKGMNPYMIREKMRELSQKWSLFMGSDYSSYEGSQDYQWQNLIEKRILKEWLLNYPDVYQQIDRIYTKGHDIYWRKRYFGHLNGKRMSGDVQTSLGNGICNALIWKFVSYKCEAPMDILVEGDDAFICTDKPLDVSIVQQLGFDCKIDGPSFNYEDICFLSMYQYHSVPFGNIPKVIDKIGTVKSSFFTTQWQQGKEDKIRDYAYTKAYCFLFMYVGTPIIDPICRQIMRVSGGKFDISLMEDHYFERLGDNFKIPYRPITPEIRRRVSEIWPQYSLQYQYELEDQVNKMDSLSYLIVQ